MTLYVVGIGPGGGSDMTARARKALARCGVIVGYGPYIDLVRADFPQAEFRITPMRREVERCRIAVRAAAEGETVALVCSGDAGVYGMASLCLEVADEAGFTDIEVVPGVTAGLAAAALFGAPLSGDFACVSLSDLLVPWDEIERRLRAAARAGFALCLYNPASRHRPDHLRRACAVLAEVLPDDTPCGIARNMGKPAQQIEATTLAALADVRADMATTVIVGTRSTRVLSGRIVTPRGYCLGESPGARVAPHASGSRAANVDAMREGLRPRIVVFGGTGEARRLAGALIERGRCEVVVSSATAYGASLIVEEARRVSDMHVGTAGDVEGACLDARAGRLDAREMEELLRALPTACAVDATHPYAAEVSANIAQAARAADVPLIRVQREEDAEGSGLSEGAWTCASDPLAAARFADSVRGNVLLTTGTKDLPVYMGGIARSRERVFARILPVPASLDAALAAGVAPSHIVAMQGPFSAALNAALIDEVGAQVLVTKASGQAGGFREKVRAARERGIELVVVQRPSAAPGMGVEDALDELERRFRV